MRNNLFKSSILLQSIRKINSGNHPAYYDLKEIFNGSIPQPVISCADTVLDNASQDASSYESRRPFVCFSPRSADQAAKCVEYCYKNNLPIIPVGARSGLEGGIHAIRGGISIDMTNMTNIIQLNEDDLDCHVEAGLTWRDLNDKLRSSGLWFPVDPGASATLGGMASTSASGTNAIKYGTMRENVLGLQAIIADGKIINTAGKITRAKKTSSGLNLTNLFVGSEGTLGLFTSVRLKLHPLPTCLAVATVAFPDVRKAVESVVRVIQCAIPVARIEFLDQPGVEACYKASKLNNLDPTKPMLFVELQGLTETNLQDQVDLMKDIFEANEASNFQWSSKLEERSKLWKARHDLHWSILKTKPGYSNIDTDVCVPISKFPEMVSRTHELIDKFGLDAPLMGHAGDGNFHSVILFKPNDAKELAKAKELARQMGLAAIDLEGTVTGEHGIGRGKIELMKNQFDDVTLSVMHQIKQTLDPKNLFNPGKIFEI